MSICIIILRCAAEADQDERRIYCTKKQNYGLLLAEYVPKPILSRLSDESSKAARFNAACTE